VECTWSIPQLPNALLIIAGERGAGKTKMAKALADAGLGQYINLSLVLARHLANQDDPTAMVRPSDMAQHLTRMTSSSLVILDNIEALFQAELNLDVVWWVRQVARDIALVIVWPGPVVHGEFSYSMPNRRDYYHSREPSLRVINLES